MKNFAIVIGINNYIHIEKLNYAEQDAQKLYDFFINELQFEETNIKILVSNSSNNINQFSPIRSNIKSGLKRLSEGNRFEVEDNLWFFFSGHGTYCEGLDYIMPLDGSMDDIQGTGVTVKEITESLKNSGAGNIIMILDACRNEGKRSGKGIGEQTIETAREKGIITFFSCLEGQSSYEVERLQGGAFTQALLEGMGRYATVGQLHEYIKIRVPQIGEENGKPLQNPRVIVNPPSKRNLILIEKNAKVDDIQTLKNNAYQALYMHNDTALADLLWRHVLMLSGGKDEEAIEAILEIRHRKQNNEQNSDFTFSRKKTVLKQKNPELRNNNQRMVAIKTMKIYILLAIFFQGILVVLLIGFANTDGCTVPTILMSVLNILWFLYCIIAINKYAKKNNL